MRNLVNVVIVEPCDVLSLDERDLVPAALWCLDFGISDMFLPTSTDQPLAMMMPTGNENSLFRWQASFWRLEAGALDAERFDAVQCECRVVSKHLDIFVF